MPSLGSILWALGAVVLGVVLWKVGMGMLRALSRPLPPPPPPGELRRVSQCYRCSVCGLELKLTMAADEQPEPPRHCMEEMEAVAPVIE